MREFKTKRLNQIDLDTNVASYGLRIGTSLLRAIENAACDLWVHALQTDVETRLDGVTTAAGAKIHFGVNHRVCRQLHLHLGCDNLYCTEKTTRPTDGE